MVIKLMKSWRLQNYCMCIWFVASLSSCHCGWCPCPLTCIPTLEILSVARNIFLIWFTVFSKENIHFTHSSLLVIQHQNKMRIHLAQDSKLKKLKYRYYTAPSLPLWIVDWFLSQNKENTIQLSPRKLEHAIRKSFRWTVVLVCTLKILRALFKKFVPLLAWQLFESGLLNIIWWH